MVLHGWQAVLVCIGAHLIAGCGKSHVIYVERGIAVQSAAALWTAAGMPVDVVKDRAAADIPRDADRIRLVRAHSLDHDGHRVCGHTETPFDSEFLPTVISIDVACIDADATLHDIAAHEFGHYLGIPNDRHLPEGEVGMMSHTCYQPEMGEHGLTCDDVRHACLFAGCDPREFCDNLETHVAESR